MTKREMASTLKHLGWNQARAAAYLGVTRGAISRWMSGSRSIPGPVAVALKRTLEASQGGTKG